ncbi:acetolactate synthase-1/2/3 large subunit [Roseomonas alkaliterrae]|uniref:Acetolactate synthase-1/2/3 large subunit n=3 Tax=Neoroseomonas alkaliterrae TaxID=1452450 RepID=A0A840XY90_9PROT|nr:thiamine pyrophosphate-dependent enzyme [Neoroseomonas alkaliterrae]MBB5689137.1 acetolactate synthase-1/2/3 large subunit [Neoroseomonas alkaliterrae]
MDATPAPAATAAEALVSAFAAAGTKRVYGVPGGGSSLDLIAAAKAQGLDFVLARHESAAVIMAATEAELSGAPGLALCTRGPGVGNAANGVAHAALDRAPVVLVADGFAPAERAFATHQYFDQAAMLGPVTKAQFSVGQMAAGEAAVRAIGAAMAAPRGAALVELSGSAARQPAAPPPALATAGPPAPDAAAIAAARRVLAAARRPVIIAGLEATEAAGPVRALAAALGCPVLVTYKAKGVVADGDPLFAGVFTCGAAEGPLLDRADAVVMAGADPVEFIARPWRWTVPVIEVATAPRALPYVAPAAAVSGALGPALEALAAGAARSAWSPDEIAALREGWRAALANDPRSGRGIGPQRVVEITQQACRAAGFDPRVAVDAGAHMFPATTFWACERPGDLLISNGLATMGFALPAGIAAALHDPRRGALAFTGDGGLLMGLGELATAATLGVRLVVVAFNDSSLSLIDIKKEARDLPEGALGWPRADLAAAMRAVGGIGLSAHSEAELAEAIATACAATGPVLVDVAVDPSGYPAQIKALRG